MNARKSLLTKALLSTGAFAVLAGSAGTAVASAATHPAPLTAVTKITNRLDGGGGGSWAYDSFARDLALTYLGKVTPAMVAANPALARVTRLSLGRCQIGEKGLAALANSPHLQQLIELELWNNNLTSAAALLDTGLLPRLIALQLGGNPIPGDAEGEVHAARGLVV